MDRYELFQGYVDICNRALERNKDRFPFKQVLGAAQKAGTKRMVEVQIIDDRPGSDFLIRLVHNKIEGVLSETRGDCRCGGRWRVARSYMEEVVRNPGPYIRNPARLDWEWMVDSHD